MTWQGARLVPSGYDHNCKPAYIYILGWKVELVLYPAPLTKNTSRAEKKNKHQRDQERVKERFHGYISHYTRPWWLPMHHVISSQLLLLSCLLFWVSDLSWMKRHLTLRSTSRALLILPSISLRWQTRCKDRSRNPGRPISGPDWQQISH